MPGDFNISLFIANFLLFPLNCYLTLNNLEANAKCRVTKNIRDAITVSTPLAVGTYARGLPMLRSIDGNPFNDVRY